MNPVMMNILSSNRKQEHPKTSYQRSNNNNNNYNYDNDNNDSDDEGDNKISFH